MSNLYEINGTYGASETESTILVYEQYNGLKWYCCYDSCNVNATYDEIEEGCNIECLTDTDTATSNEGITTLDELERFIDDEEEESPYSNFLLEIDNFDNQAMIDNPNEEVKRILEGVIKNIDNNGLLNCDGLHLRDINGNNVGSVSVWEN
jgi:hypothetical protein